MTGYSLIFCVSLTAVDGDTVRCDGELLRLLGPGQPYVSGFDTPELYGPKDCPEELEAARAARDRLSELLTTPGLMVLGSGEVDATQARRRLVWVVLPDGRTAGQVLLEEGHARVWTPDYEADWCR